MDPAVQAVADRVDAALALVCDPAFRTAARRRAGAPTTRRLFAKAMEEMQAACTALPQGLLLRPAAVASLLAMLVDNSASMPEVDLALAACACFFTVPSCLQQVRPQLWWCRFKGGGARRTLAAAPAGQPGARQCIRSGNRPGLCILAVSATLLASGVACTNQLSLPPPTPPARWRTPGAPRHSCVALRAALSAAAR